MNTLEFIGHVNKTPILVFGIKQRTDTLWVFPTIDSLNRIQFMAQMYRFN